MGIKTAEEEMDIKRRENDLYRLHGNPYVVYVFPDDSGMSRKRPYKV